MVVSDKKSGKVKPNKNKREEQGNKPEGKEWPEESTRGPVATL